ncbi:iron-hydroxamate ABC transporter substrate-binding protein [Lederbergia galactosidilytica]|uniref:Ferrichrome ABC transporter substrate-binding protein n=1 Tax=Lederbergia galactosidilytica TaxID=217031 RepID=A0A0Q9YAV2_9BACI|nr:iron-hydroxamate ABC transporter substrate-binding protein [Lederbergia galactosidilytica]KRG12573.1 ferrichrome ABC transporter substrate-binding protein [Virgibacillus soli]KRG13607.1 ferrichrome ABC transporter substrate-binding protein [Lederbergia galactosidilytica]MBP1916037.1 iron complex transport system substrate-binding protein [Lederbergia galactosidilytica]OAK68481.1 ferrichrome ABC transporter substrate-binding protein [Lederbergia galactosidilytica]
MNTLSKNKYSFFIMLIMIIFIIAGCGNNDTQKETEKSGDKAPVEENNKEITLDSEMGEVTIPLNAKKVLAPFHEDALLSIGVTPVAKWAIGTSVQNHLEDQLQTVPNIEWTLPLEQVLSYQPDLIILENTMDSYEGTYEDYQKIAPTYVMDEETVNDWQKQLDVFGQLLGKEDVAKQAINDYEKKVAESKTEVQDTIGDETVAAIWVIGGKYFVFEKDRHSAKVLYSELGVHYPQFIDELGEAKPQWEALSLEKLSELDADHVFLLAAEGEEGLDVLENSKVWNSIPAVKNNQVYVLNAADSWTNKGLIASTKTIDTFLETLKK